MKKSIKEAERKCREEWASAPNATWAWCCHHDIRIEMLTEPAENRIRYIRDKKPTDELETRFNNFRPVLSEIPEELMKAWKAYAEAGEAYCEAREACAEAWKAYAEAWKACAEAWKAYAEAWKAYAEAWKAYAEAGEACDEKLNALHLKDVPDNTWNGSIFNKT